MKKIYNPIAIYNYNQQKYFIALDNDKIMYFKYNNNKITNEYTKDELRIFFKVYNSIRINKKKAINLGIKKINGKLYETHYDKNTELYYWYEIVEGKRVIPSREDLEFLDCKYNNVNLVYADDTPIYDWSKDTKFLDADDDIELQTIDFNELQENNDTSKRKNKIKTITRSIVDGASIIAIVVIAGYGILTLSDNFLETGIKDKIAEVIGISSDDNTSMVSYDDEVYKFEKIEAAVDKNPNLTDSEKDFIKKMRYYFDMNSYNFVLPFVEERLSTLKINYVDEACECATVGGEYKACNNEITMYLSSNFENCDKTFITHEIMHAIQYGNIKRFTGELSNEFFTRELLRQMYDEGLLDEELEGKYEFSMYGRGYPQCIKVYYLLAELINPSVLKKYQWSLKDEEIINALVEIEKEHGDDSLTEEQMAANAVALLDDIDELRTNKSDEKYHTINYSQETYQKVYDRIDYYYKLKYNKSIDENLSVNIMNYDYTSGSITPLTIEKEALAVAVSEELKIKYPKYKEEYTPPLGDYRYVIAKSYLSDSHKYPILYTSMIVEGDTIYYETVDYGGVEITPEFEKKYEQKLEQLKQKQESTVIPEQENEGR